MFPQNIFICDFMSRNTSLRSTDSVYKGSINSSSSRSRSRNNRISRRSHNDSKTRPDTIIHQKVRRNRLISLSSRRNNKSVRILSTSNKYVNVICIPVNWLLPILFFYFFPDPKRARFLKCASTCHHPSKPSLPQLSRNTSLANSTLHSAHSNNSLNSSVS